MKYVLSALLVISCAASGVDILQRIKKRLKRSTVQEKQEGWYCPFVEGEEFITPENRPADPKAHEKNCEELFFDYYAVEENGHTGSTGSS